MFKNKLMLATVASASVMALTAAAPALANNHGTPGNPHEVDSSHKVGICHATGSETNPYVFIIVDEHAVKAHTNHQDHRDIIGVKSADQCPKPHVAPGKGGSTTPTPTPQSGGNGGQVLGSSASPSTLPDTGAGLSTLIGLPALAVAGRSYLRAKLQK